MRFLIGTIFRALHLLSYPHELPAHTIHIFTNDKNGGMDMKNYNMTIEDDVITWAASGSAVSQYCKEYDIPEV